MKVDKNVVIGIKMNIGPLDLGKLKSTDFVDAVQFKLSCEDYFDETGLFDGSNALTCKYFDDDKGIMYVTFDQEVTPEDLPFFGEDELIFKKIEE